MNTIFGFVVETGDLISAAGLLYVTLATLAVVHLVLHKRNEGAAFGWLGLIILSPYFGALLYGLFGINRIRRRVREGMQERDSRIPQQSSPDARAHIDSLPAQWQSLIKTGEGIHTAPYCLGNRVLPLENGDEAYPRMLAAIEAADTQVLLSSYIFEHDSIGVRFIDALTAAHQRGVQVRVLIDGLGVGYGFSLIRADRVLRRRGVKTARFLSAFSSSGTRFINLRNHRKILIVDGSRAFVGGMNIRDGNLLLEPSRHHIRDVHFEVHGSVLNQIAAVFADDWYFAAEEVLDIPRKPASDLGDVMCRVLVDGPDDNYQKLQLSLLAAIHAARERIRIVTPYFLPDRSLLDALHLATLRGVAVQLLLPGRNNLPFVDWAMQANIPLWLQLGFQLYQSRPPFDHGKFMLVDDHWSLIGSSNWDARSLELNFEINLECCDSSFNHTLQQLYDQRIAASEPVLQVRPESLPVRLRNNFCRLFTPYL